MESRALSEVAKKLQRLCEAVGARTEKMFPASSTTPAAAALAAALEALTVMTLPARSSHLQVSDSRKLRFHFKSIYQLYTSADSHSVTKELERDNRRQERAGSAYFQPAARLGQQDLAV